MTITPMKRPLSNEDNRLLRAWRNGELDEPAAHDLEARLFFEPDLLEAAQIDQDIQEGIERIDPPRPVMQPQRLWPLLAAASIGAMAVMVPVAYQSSNQTPSPMLGNVEWVRLDSVRGTGNVVPTLVNPTSETGAIIIEVPAPAGDGPFIATVVSSAGGEAPLTAQELVAIDGALTIVLPKSALKSGTYSVRVSSPSSDKPEISLPFRFEP